MAEKPIRKTKYYICSTPQTGPLTKTEFEALTFIEIGCPVDVGEIGVNASFETSGCISAETSTYYKSDEVGTQPVIRVARKVGDNGQDELIIASKTDSWYAFKYLRDDMPSGGTSGTVGYFIGVVGGMKVPEGTRDSLDAIEFQISINDRPIMVDAA